MSSFKRFINTSVLFIMTGCIGYVSAVQAGPPPQEKAGTQASAPGAQDTGQASAPGESGKYRNLFPDVVATVNGEPISGRDLEKAVSSELSSIGNPDWKHLREDYRGNLVYNLITGLINTKLLYAEAVASGTAVTDAEVQDEYLRATKTFGSDEELKAFLVEQDLDSNKMIENIHQSLLIAKYVDENIKSRVTVTPEELEKYYADNPDQFQHPDLVRTSHIMIETGKTQAEDELAQKRIDDLMARLGKGEDFAALAREYSKSPSAPQGGDIGLASRDMLPAEYAEVAFATPVGEIREVHMPQGHFIVKVTEKKKAGKSTLEQSKDQLTEFLANEKTQIELQKTINRLRNEAEIEILIPAGVLLEP